MDRRVKKTKQAIRDAYFTLLGRGSHKITISEIAKYADIDRKTFYLHYEDTDGIVKEFAEEKIGELVEWLKPGYHSKEPVSISMLFQNLNRLLEENLEYFKIMASNQKFEYFYYRLNDLFVHILMRDYQRFFHFSEAEFAVYADFYVSGILSAYMRWIREKPEISVDELASLVSTAAYGGLKELLAGQYFGTDRTEHDENDNRNV